MYADIVVLTYQAPDIDFFTYEIPDNLKIKVGQLVEVPFGKRNPQGIIIAISHSPLAISEKTKIKPISKILLSQPLLLPYQIELIKWMKNYYLAPLVNCLETILPKIPKRAIYSSSEAKRSREVQYNVKFSTRSNSNYQTVVLVPTLNKIPETLAKFPKAKNYVVYHNELKPAEKFEAWLKILSGQADYIFGSRSAIFAPCPALKEIIIYNEHDGAYKDDRSPYFDTLTVAQKISQVTGAEIKIVDPAPRITTYSALQNHIKMQQFEIKTKIVSMENERLSGNRTPLSDYLLESIKANIKHKKNTLLFLNKKKESGQLFCRNCKHQEFFKSQPVVCPKCQSPDIFLGTLNLNSLTSLLQKQLPATKINLVTEKSASFPEENNPTVDIATAFVFYTFVQKKYGLTCYISCDPLLNRADFSSVETLFAQIASLKQLTEKTGQLVLQSYNSQNPTLEFAAGGNFAEYYNDQLTQRKALNYPPFGLLVKLTLKGKSNTKVEKEAESLAANLRSTINNKQSFSTNKQLTILGPYQSIFWQKKPTYNIILKYKLKGYSLTEKEKAVAKIKSFIGSLARGWQITVDPNSIN